jgi:hydrogenase maturation protein HypF
LFEEILDDLYNGIPQEKIAGRFQNTIIEVILTMADEIRKDTGINDIVLSGGTFQNQYISERVEKMLILRKFNTYIPSSIPANDGGIALGQLLTASNYI